jgi:hypothetical protein
MREHLPGVARRWTDPTGPPSISAPDGVNQRRRDSIGGEWIALEPEPPMLARFAVIDFPLNKSPNEASQSPNEASR